MLKHISFVNKIEVVAQIEDIKSAFCFLLSFNQIKLM